MTQILSAGEDWIATWGLLKNIKIMSKLPSMSLNVLYPKILAFSTCGTSKVTQLQSAINLIFDS